MRRQFPSHKFWDHSPVCHEALKGSTTIDLGYLPPEVPKPIPELIVAQRVSESPERRSNHSNPNYANEYLSRTKEISPGRYKQLLSKEEERVILYSREEQLKKYKQNQRALQWENMNILANNYKDQMLNKTNKSMMARRVDYEKEQYNAREAQRLLMEDKVRQMHKRKQLRADFQMSLKITDEKKRRAQEVAKAEKQAYNQMIEDNSRKEINRELDYRRKFMNYHTNLLERQAVHKKAVLRPAFRKDQRYSLWVQNNEQTYNHYRKRKEDAEYDWKKQQTENIANVLQIQIAKKEMAKNEYKRSYPNRAMENLSMTAANENLRNLEKARKQRIQEEYGQFLKKQQELTQTDNNYRKHSHNQNQSVNIDRTSFGLIPGINNIASVGTRPTNRIGKEIIYGSNWHNDSDYGISYPQNKEGNLDSFRSVQEVEARNSPKYERGLSQPSYKKAQGRLDLVPSGQKELMLLNSQGINHEGSESQMHSSPISPSREKQRRSEIENNMQQL